jgi:hypothetical protein
MKEKKTKVKIANVVPKCRMAEKLNRVSFKELLSRGRKQSEQNAASMSPNKRAMSFHSGSYMITVIGLDI